MADVTFSDSTFQSQVLQSKTPVIVDFWSNTCPPCKIIAHIIDELAAEYKGKVVIGKMNTDENSQTPGMMNVMGIPTVMFFKNGRPVHALTGAQSKQTYKSEIEKLLQTA